MSVPEREEKAELATEPGAAERAVAPPSPDGFRLEGEMPSVMRLSRRTLAIIGGTAGLAIAGALLWALRPPEPDPPANVYETARSEERRTGQEWVGKDRYRWLPDP